MKQIQQGYGLIEYILGVGVLTTILFVPINKGESLSSTLIEAVKKEHAAYIHISSIANVDAVLSKLSSKKRK